MKAHIELERALGDLLEKDRIRLDDPPTARCRKLPIDERIA